MAQTKEEKYWRGFRYRSRKQLEGLTESIKSDFIENYNDKQLKDLREQGEIMRADSKLSMMDIMAGLESKDKDKKAKVQAFLDKTDSIRSKIEEREKEIISGMDLWGEMLRIKKTAEANIEKVSWKKEELEKGSPEQKQRQVIDEMRNVIYEEDKIRDAIKLIKEHGGQVTWTTRKDPGKSS